MTSTPIPLPYLWPCLQPLAARLLLLLDMTGKWRWTGHIQDTHMDTQDAHAMHVKRLSPARGLHKQPLLTKLGKQQHMPAIHTPADAASLQASFPAEADQSKPEHAVVEAAVPEEEEAEYLHEALHAEQLEPARTRYYLRTGGAAWAHAKTRNDSKIHA